MKKQVVFILVLLVLPVFSCPSYSLRDNTVMEIKRGCSKLYLNVINQTSMFMDEIDKQGDLEKSWTSLNQDWMVFHTKLSSWIRLLPDELGRDDWDKALDRFHERIQALVLLIKQKKIDSLKEECTAFKEDFILFFHWHPPEAMESALKTGDVQLFSRVVNDLPRIRSEQKIIVEFKKKTSEIDPHFKETKKVDDFLLWLSSNEVLLRGGFAGYYEKNSWY